MKKIVCVMFCLLIAASFVMGCGGDDAPTVTTPTASAVVIGGTPINSAPPATTTKTGTPIISNLVLNPTTAKASDRITFSLAFTDTDANVNTFGIQFNGENKYYTYDVSSVASGNLAFNLTVQDTIGNVSPGSYQIVVFILDKLGNVSNYLTGTLTVQGSSPTDANIVGTWDVAPGLKIHFYGDKTWKIIGPLPDDGGHGTYTVLGQTVTLEGIGNWKGERLWGTGTVLDATHIDLTMNSSLEPTLRTTIVRTSTTP
jgi:hypothetical protein